MMENASWVPPFCISPKLSVPDAIFVILRFIPLTSRQYLCEGKRRACLINPAISLQRSYPLTYCPESAKLPDENHSALFSLVYASTVTRTRSRGPAVSLGPPARDEAYYDMAFLLDRFPQARSTFNFPVPPAPIGRVFRRPRRISSWNITQRPQRSSRQRKRPSLIATSFRPTGPPWCAPFPLTRITGETRPRCPGTGLGAAGNNFPQELLDLQVWHNLAWFGYGSVCNGFPASRNCARRIVGFTEEDKRDPCAGPAANSHPSDHAHVRALQDREQIELTTTPFFTRSFPWSSTGFTRRARPDLPLRRCFLPSRCGLGAARGEYHTRIFGRAPVGSGRRKGRFARRSCRSWHKPASAGSRRMRAFSIARCRWLARPGTVYTICQPYAVGTDAPSSCCFVIADLQTPSVRLSQDHPWIHRRRRAAPDSQPLP